MVPGRPSTDRVETMPSAETPNHRRLKALAVAWAQANGFAICGLEVRIPRSGYRADVAAGGRSADLLTAIFECKQARSDLLKDAHAEALTRQRLAELVIRRRKLEELFAMHRPDLRRGEALFPEYDAWDFSRLQHRTYRRVLAELGRLQRRVASGAKFSKMIRYRCADLLYLVVEENIFAEAEIPAGWGLLVRRGARLELARPPAQLSAAAEQRVALLESIAVAGTRAALRTSGTPAWVGPSGGTAGDAGGV